MDLKLIENGSGGDLVFDGGDLKTTSEIYNQPYLARFGGNKTASTGDGVLDGEERRDYWANSLLLANSPNEQHNSKFEKGLSEIPLSSSGRLKLESIAKDDLKYLDGTAECDSKITIESVDRIMLKDSITNKNSNNFSYIWNAAKDEIIEQ